MKNNPFDNNLDQLAIEQCAKIFTNPGEPGTLRHKAIGAISRALIAAGTFQTIEQATELDQHPNNPRNSGGNTPPVGGC
ncbi:hypothetical protein BH11ACT6_BH11ACT6_53410 [soil metagenome]